MIATDMATAGQQRAADWGSVANMPAAEALMLLRGRR